MSSIPALQELARLIGGEPRAALGRLLALVCELLAMDASFVSVCDSAGGPTVRLWVQADGSSDPAGLAEVLDATWCGQVEENGPLFISDVRDGVSPQPLPSTAMLPIVSYAGVPLFDEDGTVFG